MKSIVSRSIVSRMLVAFVAAFAAFAMIVPDADARRFGGGRSFGKQSGNVTNREAPAQRRAADADRPSQGQQQGASPQGTRGSRWLGPIGGLVAGLGLAALFSHLGFGEALAEFLGAALLFGGLAFGAMFLLRRLRGSVPASPAMQPAYASAGPAPAGHARRETFREPASPDLGRETPGASVSVTGHPIPALAGSAAASGASWHIPADLDVAGFERTARVNFIRLQAAWDSGDLDDLRQFTTPEVYAEARADLDARGNAVNRTEVEDLEARLLGIEERAGLAVASVRFSGRIREDDALEAVPFAETWNLVKRLDGRSGWLVGGIQQEPAD